MSSHVATENGGAENKVSTPLWDVGDPRSLPILFPGNKGCVYSALDCLIDQYGKKRMKLFAHVMLITSTIASWPALAGDAVISVSIGQPGFYGRIDIGSAPQPELVYTAPIVVRQAPVSVYSAPPAIYLHVPPGHEKHWDKHCREYSACGVPVYFVRDNWYNTVYVDHYRVHGHDHDRGDDDNHGDRGKHHGNHGHDKDD